MRLAGLIAAILAAGAIGAAAAPAPQGSSSRQAAPGADQGNAPQEPFEIAEGLYYVGARDYAAYLFTTSDGLIVLDGGFDTTAPQILANIRTLGFDPKKVRYLINSHGHLDHAGGLAALKAATGATLVASRQEAPLIERGGKGDFNFGDSAPYPPAKVDRLIEDGGTLSLGGVTLTAHVTAGHTRGCTTWTGTFTADGRPRQALFLCSVSVLPTYKLVNDPNWPGQAQAYERTFAVLKGLPCEIFLGSHARFWNMLQKRQAQKAGARANPCVDPEGCRSFVEAGEATFRARLKAAQAAAG